MKRRAITLLAVVLATLAVASCATFPKTGSLDAVDLRKGYRYELLDASVNRDDLFVVVTFSGGGTRAAALAYGVLEELRRTTVTIRGERRNLLKEVDIISSVSGGSFTAAYYGLRGDEIFEEGGRFQKNFLYRNVEADLLRSVANPYNWFRLASPEFGRIEYPAAPSGRVAPSQRRPASVRGTLQGRPLPDHRQLRPDQGRGRAGQILRDQDILRSGRR